MKVTKKLTFDLSVRGAPPVVDAVQNDANSRVISASLFSESTPWEPTGFKMALAYKKPDRTTGLYDKLPNGSPAIQSEGNTVNVTLAPQVLTVAGDVDAEIVFMSSNTLDRVATFPLIIRVAKDPSGGASTSNDYYEFSTIAEINTALGKKIDKSSWNDEKLSASYLNSSLAMVDRCCPNLEVTAPVVTCNPLEGYPLKVKSQIVPKQEGSGDPSPTNVRKILPWTGAKLTQCGKNLLDASSIKSVDTLNIDILPDKRLHVHGIVPWAYPIVLRSKLQFKTGATYTISSTVYDKSLEIRVTKTSASGTKIISTSSGASTFTVETDSNYALTVVTPNGKGAYIDSTIGLMVSASNQEEAYEPYSSSDFTATFPESVNAGSYDWNTGDLIITDPVIKTVNIKPSGTPTGKPGVNTLYTDTGDTTISGRSDPNAVIANQQKQIDELKQVILATGGNV